MDTPAMISQVARHRRCPFQPPMTSDQPRQSQTFVFRAEVGDTSHQVHPTVQCPALSSQGARASRQVVNTTAKRAVDALNEGGVDLTFALCLLDYCGHHFLRPAIDVARDADHPMAFILLDDLGDQNVGPSDEAATPGCSTRLFLAKDFQDRGRITRQAVGAEAQRPARAPRHNL